jgi:hypothetical protein
MKKLLAALIAALLVATSAPSGASELFKNLRMSCHRVLQATAATNVADFATHANCDVRNSDGTCKTSVLANNDRIGDAQTRLLLRLDWDLLDDVHARVTLRKNDRTYGTVGGNPQSVSDVPPQSITSAGPNILGSVFVDEAFFKVDKIAGQLDLTMGRQFYGESGDMVVYFGPSEKAWYGLPVSAIDGARLDWNGESLAVTGFDGKLAGSQVGTVPQSSFNIRGLNLALKGQENVHGSIYGWNREFTATGASGAPPTDAGDPGGKNDELYVLGAKGKVSGGGFYLQGEFDQNLGENRNGLGDAAHAPAARYAGWATQGRGGFKAESDNLGSLALWSEGTVMSGRQNTRENVNDGFVPIWGDYRPGSIYGRFSLTGTFPGLASAVPGVSGSQSLPFADVSLLRSNQVIWGGGIKASPGFANRLSAGVSWWDYRIHRFNNVPGGTNEFSGNKHLGSELDVDLSWYHSENVTFGTGWATFQPGGLIKESVRLNDIGAGTPGRRGVNPVSLVYFDVRVKFGSSTQ